MISLGVEVVDEEGERWKVEGDDECQIHIFLYIMYVFIIALALVSSFLFSFTVVEKKCFVDLSSILMKLYPLT